MPTRGEHEGANDDYTNNSSTYNQLWHLQRDQRNMDSLEDILLLRLRMPNQVQCQ